MKYYKLNVKKRMKYLKDLFEQYALELGQIINNAKSIIFSGSITPGRLSLIV
jgi:hypothetical protein